MEDFSRVQKLLNNGTFGVNHYAANLKLSDPIVPALEYFLSLENVTGFSKKFSDLKNKPIGLVTQNARRIQWASLCAELGTYCLLGKILDIPLVAFDITSPRALRPKSDCDVVAVVNGHLMFIEVKRNAAEDKKILPELLEKRLAELELPFSVSAELLDRDYDCSDLDVRLSDIKQHVTSFLRPKKTGQNVTEPRPSTYTCGSFCVRFLDSPSGNKVIQSFSPIFAKDLKPYLVGPAALGRNGKPMKPMVDQAIEKGADYLFYRAPLWESWQEIVEECFADVTYSNGRTYFTTDPVLRKLRGIVLFARYNEFCIVNNLNVDDGNWLVA